MKNIFKLLIAILIPEVVGGISGLFTFDGIKNWYSTLHKPFFNPPNFIFGPVWTLLYMLMGISLYLVWKEPASGERTRAVRVFALQLFLNFWWSIIFFTFKSPGWALAEVAVLWLSIAWMIFAMRAVKPLAGYLQVPYLLWVSFAAVLNMAICILN